MIKFFFFALIFTSLLACNRSNHKDIREMLFMIKTNNLLKKSLKNGDCKIFQDVIVNKHLGDQGYSFFYYSQIMANKYNCSIAYYFLAVDSDTDKGTCIEGITV